MISEKRWVIFNVVFQIQFYIHLNQGQFYSMRFWNSPDQIGASYDLGNEKRSRKNGCLSERTVNFNGAMPLLQKMDK